MKIGSVFSGIGGLDLAVEAVTGGKVAWHSEIDPYACHVLSARWPGVQNLGDIKDVHHPPSVDAMCGGFPCQDISVAGKGAGLSGGKSGLWWEYHRLVEEASPRLVFIENVAALLRRGLQQVVGSLSELGFDAEWCSLSASSVGATHRRNRVFVLAYRDRGDLRKLAEWNELHQAERRDRISVDPREPVAHGVRRRFEGSSTKHGVNWRDGSWNDPHGRDSSVVYPPPPDDGKGWVRWIGAGGPAPGVCRSAYGSPSGLDARRRRGRIRCLGNGVVPRQATAAFLSLINRGATEEKQ